RAPTGGVQAALAAGAAPTRARGAGPPPASADRSPAATAAERFVAGAIGNASRRGGAAENALIRTPRAPVRRCAPRSLGAPARHRASSAGWLRTWCTETPSVTSPPAKPLMLTWFFQKPNLSPF